MLVYISREEMPLELLYMRARDPKVTSAAHGRVLRKSSTLSTLGCSLLAAVLGRLRYASRYELRPSLGSGARV